MPAWIPGWHMIDGKDGKGKRRMAHLTWLAIAVITSFPMFPVLPVLPFFPVLPVLAQKDLKHRIDSRLDASPFNRQLWGIAVVDESGRLLYGRNENRLFIPASNTKLVVSAVAAALLPPDWKVKTT